jgi:hypothetical protein
LRSGLKRGVRSWFFGARHLYRGVEEWFEGRRENFGVRPRFSLFFAFFSLFWGKNRIF